jgi:cytochrome P450
MQRQTDRVTQSWQDGEQRDMLVEMREIALLILFDTLFGVDFQDDLRRLWPDILKTLQFISPGPWLVFPGLPRPGYHRALRRMDQYLHELIDGRRRRSSASPDLLSSLLDSGMPAGRIRDQLLTLLIAGHDTSTALLAWTLFLLGSHPADMARLSAEVDLVLGKQNEPASVEQIEGLRFLDQVIQESLRLYPPVHLGSRIAARDLVFQGYRIPAGTRVMYSIYLTHRMGRYWPEPQRFLPERFTPENNRKRPHYTYLPFGGGSRNCIGLGFARLEVKIVLARLLQTFDLNLLDDQVYAHMGATLEPRPGVWMSAFRR